VKLVLQRVLRASVTVSGSRVAEIGPGLVILVGVRKGDGEAQADWLAEKTAHLRIFEDDAGKMNRSLLEAGGSALVVSQFTLLAGTEKGRRPSFIDAEAPAPAEALVAHFARRLASHGIPVQTGQFSAYMLVELVNEGPVTIVLER
jgi:D-tyrosyl-tRNA(Tyr) deacylase